MRILKVVLFMITVMVLGMIGFVYLAPEQATSLFIKADRSRSGLMHNTLDLPDGLRFAYLEGGRGEPLMLLHGFGGNKDHFVKTARYLTGHYRVIIPDLIGFGESSHPDHADYTPMAQAERLQGFIAALGIRRLHLGGNSMGGQIAMTFAARYPDIINSLWLLDPAGVWSAPQSELIKIIAETGRNPLIVKSNDDFVRVIEFSMPDPPFLPGPIISVLAQERIRNADHEERILDQIRADSVEKRVRGMTIPALIVWGEKDRVLNAASADILHKLLLHSQVVIMPGVGHLPMLEKPRASAEYYLQFRATL